MFKKVISVIIILIIIFFAFYFYLSNRLIPSKVNYGVSFNTLYAKELNLDWEIVYDSILSDLGVKRLRLAAHWNMIEPEDDQWNFEEMDKQLNLAREKNVEVILAVGRRLPRWPECHTPHWAINKPWNEQKDEIKEYLEIVVDRYKDYENIIYFQVENEPFLEVFAKEHCGNLDEEFLDEEIELVKRVGKGKQILVTDSGNLGTWYRPWKKADAFGTSVYVYLWNKEIGPFKSYLPASFYRAKASFMDKFINEKKSMLIELSLEPWLLQPVVETSIETQLERMNIYKFNEIIKFAKETRFEDQYLWGAEWWYYMNQNGHPEFWNEAKKIFN